MINAQKSGKGRGGGKLAPTPFFLLNVFFCERKCRYYLVLKGNRGRETERQREKKKDRKTDAANIRLELVIRYLDNPPPPDVTDIRVLIV